MCRILADINRNRHAINEFMGLDVGRHDEKAMQKHQNIHLDYDSEDEHDLF
jgi:hypothetical protein